MCKFTGPPQGQDGYLRLLAIWHNFRPSVTEGQNLWTTTNQTYVADLHAYIPNRISTSFCSFFTSSQPPPSPPSVILKVPPQALTMLEGKAVIGETDMLQTMQQDALSLAAQALDVVDVTDSTEIARFIKKEFDKSYRPGWAMHCGERFWFLRYPLSWLFHLLLHW